MESIIYSENKEILIVMDGCHACLWRHHPYTYDVVDWFFKWNTLYIYTFLIIHSKVIKNSVKLSYN